MNYNRNDMKFIKVTDSETAHKLRYEGFTEIPSSESGVYMFINDGKKLTFDAERYGAVYTNILSV
jgi:hypothetical protein